MPILLNTEYLLKASYFVSTDISMNYVHPERGCVNIFDFNGFRFYAATDGSMLIEFKEPISGEKLPVNNIMIKKPNLKILGAAKEKYTIFKHNYENFYQTFINQKKDHLIPITLENGNKKIETDVLKGVFPGYRNTMMDIQSKGNFLHNKFACESMMDKEQLATIEKRLGIKKEDLLFRLDKDTIFCMYKTQQLIVLAASFRHKNANVRV